MFAIVVETIIVIILGLILFMFDPFSTIMALIFIITLFISGIMFLKWFASQIQSGFTPKMPYFEDGQTPDYGDDPNENIWDETFDENSPEYYCPKDDDDPSTP